jgi:phosphoribosylformylglycinamidine (FGAM) synthase-like enzyme
MADACRALGVVVVSGNVSLYNETSESAIYPTPTIGCVGVLDDIRLHARMTWTAGDKVLLLGGSEPALGGSEYLAVRHGLTAGRPPALDLAAEATVQELVRDLIASGIVSTAHDISLGGLAIALAEMAIRSGIGVSVSVTESGRRDAFWFGERASAIIVAVEPGKASRVLDAATVAGVAAIDLGEAAGDAIDFGVGDAIEIGTATIAYESALLTAEA